MSFILDDFSNPEGISNFGTEWILFSDQVMGGASLAQAEQVVYQERACLHLSGEVSLQNNGGFVQVALPLVHSRYLFDARHFQGVEVTVCSPQSQGYFIHLRTRELSMPWQHYAVPFFPTPQWQTLHLPFSAFYPVSTGHALNLERLTRIGIVAGKREFHANLYISEIGFYV